jgi:hypothetical protein
MATQKLKAAFKECADKLVDMQELGQLSLKQYEKQLTKTELAKIFGLFMNSAYMSNVADKTLGMIAQGKIRQSADGRLFTTIKDYQEMDSAIPSPLSKALTKKVNDIASDIIRSAPDYRKKSKALGFS